jgi:hypothetical protein
MITYEMVFVIMKMNELKNFELSLTKIQNLFYFVLQYKIIIVKSN